ncbi:NAD-dependent epimerase/dehydratase family protein [Kiloniella litopenaei]|uniref:NAD-dependent epimerase/dehydratase family protein n=1 Tax=Kiloniella litopenaei TaxID=1549748 RepID=UPI003BABA47E
MQRVVICGATGFIGRNLVEYFSAQKGYEVVAVSHNRPEYAQENVTWVNADLRNAREVNELLSGTDIVIQAAATTSGAKDITTKPFIHVTDNAVMNSHLLRSAYEQAVKHFVFFSCTVMYPSSDHLVSEEDFSGEITDKYFGVGWTKVYIEKMCEFYAGLGRTKHTVIRHSNIYGPYDKFDLERSHVFGATITKAMLADKELMIWGTGEEKRDLLHVDDLVNFVSLALSKQEHSLGLYNCGLGQTLSIKSLVEKVVQATGKKLDLKHDLSKPTIPFNLGLDCSKAMQELGWKPKVGLDEGIQSTVKWWKDNIDSETLGLKL